VCTVIGFPLGTSSTKIKCLEAQRAVLDGADECDMVINIGALKSGNLQYVQNEIACIKNTIGKIVLKVIIETCLLTDDEKRVMCDVVCNAGADFIKTSTGFSTGGATFDDIKIFAECVKGRCKIKAAGGIKTKDDMETFLSLGADRLGTSSAVNILEQK
ncbi:MAG: deoxyribose-phosphate aldolase, partial [Oscillospiraceae bacterium]